MLGVPSHMSLGSDRALHFRQSLIYILCSKALKILYSKRMSHRQYSQLLRSHSCFFSEGGFLKGRLSFPQVGFRELKHLEVTC